MGFFSFGSNKTKCKECGSDFPDSERLKKHQEKAHKKIKKNVDYVDPNLIIQRLYENIKKSVSNLKEASTPKNIS